MGTLKGLCYRTVPDKNVPVLRIIPVLRTLSVYSTEYRTNYYCYGLAIGSSRVAFFNTRGVSWDLIIVVSVFFECSTGCHVD